MRTDFDDEEDTQVDKVVVEEPAPKRRVIVTKPFGSPVMRLVLRLP